MNYPGIKYLTSHLPEFYKTAERETREMVKRQHNFTELDLHTHCRGNKSQDQRRKFIGNYMLQIWRYGNKGFRVLSSH